MEELNHIHLLFYSLPKEKKVVQTFVRSKKQEKICLHLHFKRNMAHTGAVFSHLTAHQTYGKVWNE